MSRHEDARKVRREAAEIAHDRPFTHDGDHKDNMEEEDYHDAHGNRNFIGNFSKGLPHHPIGDSEAGEVIADAYRTMLKALKSEKVSDFENIQLGLGRKLTNPQAGIAFDLEGPDSHDLFQRPAPRIDRAEAAGEIAELYWMALCRDVKFADFGTDPIVSCCSSRFVY